MCLIAATIGLPTVSAQEVDDLNQYYRFPLSLGFSYRPLNPVSSLNGVYSINELSGELRRPIQASPVVQPFLRGGAVTFDSQDEQFPERRDHTDLFAELGLGLAWKTAKSFEVGATIGAGGALSQFPNLLEDASGNTVGASTINARASASLEVVLNPTYNLSINVEPGIRYSRNLGGTISGYGAFREYDGFYFGVGFGLRYRIGTDPDAPEAEIRAIEFADVEMPPVFAAMQSVYVEEPLVTVPITNSSNRPIEGVEIAFFQNGYMDSPTTGGSIDRLEPGATAELAVRAAFNGEVFRTNGITPLNGELIVSYFQNGRPAEQRMSITYDLHDRNALTWDDDRKVGAFITPSDSAIRNYASYIRTSLRDATNDFLPEPLQFAMQVYSALAEQGLLYQVDPASPFTQAQENPLLVDSISLPRETLRRITGDCDDITVLFNTIMETAGFETGFVTTPGHIYSAVNTGVPANEYDIVHPDRSRTLIIDGEVWVLIEITLIGSQGFMEAWNTGIRQWRDYDEEPERRALHRTREAQNVFRPVGLVETDLGLQYAERDGIERDFRETFNRLADLLLQPYRELALAEDDERAWNRYGVRAAMIDRLEIARTAFNRAAERSRRGVDPLINLGSLEFLAEQYDASFATFQRALSELEGQRRVRSSTQVTVLINLAKSAYQLQQFDQAEDYFAQAEQIDPDRASEFAYVAAASEDGGRASQVGGGPPILFADSEGGEELE